MRSNKWKKNLDIILNILAIFIICKKNSQKSKCWELINLKIQEIYKNVKIRIREKKIFVIIVGLLSSRYYTIIRYKCPITWPVPSMNRPQNEPAHSSILDPSWPKVEFEISLEYFQHIFMNQKKMLQILLWTVQNVLQ